MSENDDGPRITPKVAGRIEPDGHGGRRFTIVGRRSGEAPPANVRPCPHPRFILDDEWNTVTCGKCGERLDPYAALRSYADWWSEFEFRRTMAESASKDLYADLLRQLARRRGATEAEREEIRELVGMRQFRPLEELKDAHRRIERAINERGRA